MHCASTNFLAVSRWI
uniref:Uncharacterized protein n=1 Tax=Rhizophora mucronata TaxID=61149 RepID=A0A2P2IPL0_RHIMU